MHYKQFITYNSIGGILWVLVVSLLGFFFGNIPFIANNFSIAIIVIILISILPAIIGIFKEKSKSKKELA